MSYTSQDVSRSTCKDVSSSSKVGKNIVGSPVMLVGFDAVRRVISAKVVTKLRIKNMKSSLRRCQAPLAWLEYV